MAIAALLHDAVEDQGGRPTLERVRAEYGERVAHIVEGCTDSETRSPNLHGWSAKRLTLVTSASTQTRK